MSQLQSATAVQMPMKKWSRVSPRVVLVLTKHLPTVGWPDREKEQIGTEFATVPFSINASTSKGNQSLECFNLSRLPVSGHSLPGASTDRLQNLPT